MPIMTYPHLHALPALLAERLISARRHPQYPLIIYNYTVGVHALSPAEWPEALRDCRGLILEESTGAIVGRPFRKFWNYEQVQNEIPVNEPFCVWEKVDGSLGIVCNYRGHLIVSTRGTFESDQALAAGKMLQHDHAGWMPPPGLTYLFEIIYPENRIVVDYGNTRELVLLAVLDENAVDRSEYRDACRGFRIAKRFQGVTDFARIKNDPAYAGQEGFVVQWQSGLRAKVKMDEYVRIHELIYTCSSRTIWQTLRAGGEFTELMERVPPAVAQWARNQITAISGNYQGLLNQAREAFAAAPPAAMRKDFAAWALKQKYPSLMFALLDGKDISAAVWKLVEPKWETPFETNDTE